MTENEIFEKYEKDERVIGLVELINGNLNCTKKTHKAAVKYLVSIEHEAMREAGIEPVEGQWEFADVVFFDFLFSPEGKIHWLEKVKGNEKRVEYLKSRIKPKPSYLKAI
jgi:hypothetical protein